jgi:hypothetical protein
VFSHYTDPVNEFPLPATYIIDPIANQHIIENGTVIVAGR